MLQLFEGFYDLFIFIIVWFNIDIFYLKIICFFYRKYLFRVRYNFWYVYFCCSVIEVFFEILWYLVILYRELQFNGCLQLIKWYVILVVIKDFLFFVMFIVLDFYFDNEVQWFGEWQSFYSLYFWICEQWEEMICSFEQMIEIWKGFVDILIEVVKVLNVLEVMLVKIKSFVWLDSVGVSLFEVVMCNDFFGLVDLGVLQLEYLVVMMLGMLLSGNYLSGNLFLVFEIVQSFGGIIYLVFDLGLKLDVGVVFDFVNVLLLDGVQFLLFMFNSMVYSGMDFGSNFDWVSSFIILC